MKNPSRLSLARLPTPIQRLEKTSKKTGKEIFIWRDDLNGLLESGNKLRKLEFLMADALSQGCDWVVTCGGPQSNHTRATVVIARQLGLGVSILTLPKPGFDRSKTPNGNLLLNQIFEPKMIWLDHEEFQKRGTGYSSFLNEEGERLKKSGKKPYLIPLGGSNSLGCQGYETAVTEMLQTWKSAVGTHAPESLFCALGSGGTFVGLQLGLQLQKLNTQLYGINVIGPIETAQKYVSSLHESLLANRGVQIDIANSHQVDGYVGAGYSIASDHDLEFYSEFAREEGILLDPCYTGKAFQGMLSEITKDPKQYGKQILFLHSGGVFGNFAYAEQYERALKNKTT